MVDAGVISGLKYLLVSGAINARIQAGWTLRNVVIDGKYGSLYSFSMQTTFSKMVSCYFCCNTCAEDKKSLVLTGGCIQPLLEIVRSKVFYANDVALEGNSSLRFSHFDFEIIKKDDLGDILEEREQAFVILARTSTDGNTLIETFLSTVHSLFSFIYVLQAPPVGLLWKLVLFLS